jgi:hypothetical protein
MGEYGGIRPVEPSPSVAVIVISAVMVSAGTPDSVEPSVYIQVSGRGPSNEAIQQYGELRVAVLEDYPWLI